MVTKYQLEEAYYCLYSAMRWAGEGSFINKHRTSYVTTVPDRAKSNNMAPFSFRLSTMCFKPVFKELFNTNRFFT